MSTQGFNFEIDYPELPPGGRFKIIYLSSLPGLPVKNVEIYFDGGQGKSALSDSNSGNWVWLIFVANILFMALGLRDIMANHLEFRASYQPYEGILLKKKPWYLNEGRW